MTEIAALTLKTYNRLTDGNDEDKKQKAHESVS